MSAGMLIAFGVLGGFGAVVRFVVTDAVARRWTSAFPYGTLVVNLSGALALGVLVGAAVDGEPHRLAAVGFLGAFTTFSAWAFDSHRLAQSGRPSLAAANLALSLVLGLGAVWLGRELGAAL